MAFLIAWLYAMNALLAAVAPPPDQFVTRMFRHGHAVVVPGSFVGITFRCHKHDPHTCLAGLLWLDGGSQYVVHTGP